MFAESYTFSNVYDTLASDVYSVIVLIIQAFCQQCPQLDCIPRNLQFTEMNSDEPTSV